MKSEFSYLCIHTNIKKDMEKSIKGTRTEQNLLKAFAGESQARSRYVFLSLIHI